jgi:cell division protein ZapA (FtsZ GTPase activity inhibitor)
MTSSRDSGAGDNNGAEGFKANRPGAGNAPPEAGLPESPSEPALGAGKIDALAQRPGEGEDSEPKQGPMPGIEMQPEKTFPPESQANPQTPETAPKGEETSQPLEPDFGRPVSEPGGVVSFVMFSRKYHVKTDQPELVAKLAETIHSHVREIRSRFENASLFDLDVLVQASFRMALKLHNALGEKDSSRENIGIADKKIQNLIDFIDKNL